MESEYKISVTRTELSTSSVHTNHHSGHALSELDIKSLTNDNHNRKQNNHTAFGTNRTLTKATNTVVRGIVDFKTLNYSDTSRHDTQTQSTTAAVVLSYCEDNYNNNCDPTQAATARTATMSHSNFVLSFDHQQAPSPGETLLSPAEAPFGRRYAEISQFKNHPNVEW